MINYIKVKKDYDDYNIIISFSKNEWFTIKAIIERAYVEKEDLFHSTLNEERSGFDSRVMERIFDDICEMGNLIDYD